MKGERLSSDPQTVDVAARGDVAVELATKPLPPPVAMPAPDMPPAGDGAAAIFTAEPTPTLEATPVAPAASQNPGGVRLGLMLGLVSLPRPCKRR